MTALSLPALDGRKPLAFLAGLGVLRLVTEHGHPDARLSWTADTCTAQLHGAHQSIEDLAEQLRQVVDSIPDGGVLPDAPADWPPRGAAPDRLRLTRAELRVHAARYTDPTNLAVERWLCGLVTDLAVGDDGRAQLSLYSAPSGRQSTRTMLQEPLAAVRQHPQALVEALHGWRRYPDVTGEYLDHEVLRDAANAPDGRSRERGVPGATWLALMAYPLFLTATEHGQLLTSGWQPSAAPGGRPRLVYPLWTAPVDVHAAVTLLTHPILADPALQPGPAPAAAHPATIIWICMAGRRLIPDRSFAGVLTPQPPRRPEPSPRIGRGRSSSRSSRPGSIAGTGPRSR